MLYLYVRIIVRPDRLVLQEGRLYRLFPRTSGIHACTIFWVRISTGLTLAFLH